MDICLQVLKESNKSRFDSYSVRNSILIISHITFRDCRAHVFSDNLSQNSCMPKLVRLSYGKITTSDMALKQWHEDRQMKCWQTTWRWVKIVTVTRTTANTIVTTNSDVASSSICKITCFEFWTRNIPAPSKSASL